MTIKHIIGPAAVGVMLTACRPGAYRISGTIESLGDSETVYMAYDDGTATPHPADSAAVTHGKFSFKGTADSLRLAIVYSKSRPERNAPLLLEPGTIIVKIGGNSESTRVWGTFCNNKWQELNDSLLSIGRNIDAIARYVYVNNLTHEEQQAKMAEMRALEQQFRRTVRHTADENASNSFGRFMQSYYKDILK